MFSNVSQQENRNKKQKNTFITKSQPIQPVKSELGISSIPNLENIFEKHDKM